MNILVIASLTSPATANYLVRAFRDSGHQVFVCSDVASPLASLHVHGVIDVAQLCKSHSLAVDLVLFVEGGTMRLFPAGLEHMTCLTAWYGIDTHMDYAKHLRIGRLFDVTFIAQREYVARLKADGLKQVHWLPLAFAPELMPAQILQRTIDIAYVGSANAVVHPVRHALLEALQQAFASTRFGPATPGEMGETYASARIVFNRSVSNDVNMRFFEAAGAGSVLVSNPIVDNGVETLFKEGVHYFTYTDEVSLLELVRELLSDPVRCAAIGSAAREHVLAGHTYAHRVASLLDKLGSAKKLAVPQHEDLFAACLALGLLSGAIQAAATALKAQGGGRYSRLAGRLAALLLRPLGAALNVVEQGLASRQH
jgi:hypothetical protein